MNTMGFRMLMDQSIAFLSVLICRFGFLSKSMISKSPSSVESEDTLSDFATVICSGGADSERVSARDSLRSIPFVILILFVLTVAPSVSSSSPTGVVAGRT